jgi:hypothetical protein
MASLFESFLQPGAILITGLLGCFGAPWAMWATQTTFDLVAMIGLFILIGIIVNNGIMLVDRVTQLRVLGVKRDEALAQAGRDRLRPVLMTALTTIFGLVPMLIHHPTLAGVYYHSIAIIIAAGSWSSELVKVPPFVKPIRGQLLALSMNTRPAARVVWGSDCYIVPWSDGTVLVGATVEDVGFDERTTTAGIRGLMNAAVDLLPGLEHAQFREARVGLRPKTVDELPAIGRSSTMPHVFYATGHYRNGVLLAPLTATLIADLVLDGRERPELADVRPDRFGL